MMNDTNSNHRNKNTDNKDNTKQSELLHASTADFRIRHKRSAQNFLLIWLDAHIDENNEDYKNYLKQLRKIVITVELFTNADECIDYLNSIKDDKIFLIISGSLGQNTVPLIHDLTQLDTIFIFCRNKDWHKLWAKDWSKIEGVHSSIHSICKQLTKLTRDCDQNAMPMSFVPKKKTAAETNQEKLDQLPSTYMYTVLFKEIILDIKEDQTKSINDLIIYCRDQNVSESELNDFQHQYHKKSPVRWYTEDIFLYGMLNKALRSFDMIAMTKFGFFIRNLHRQLERLHKEQYPNFEKQFTVYRGQALTKEDFQHLLNIEGGLLSFNSFLSTSTSQQVAMDFVRRTMKKNKDMIGVLFIMTIDLNMNSISATPFALVDSCSAIQAEQEVLFTILTVFRIMEIKKSAENNNLWEVRLIITNENDPELAVLTDFMKQEIRGNGWYRMAEFMIKVGHFEQAELLYNELLNDTSNDSYRAHIYHEFGTIKLQQGQYGKAIKFYEKSIETTRKTMTEDGLPLANTYNNMGLAYNYMGIYGRALESYEKARIIKEELLSPDDPDLALTYVNIGFAYSNMGDYVKALEFYEKAQQIYEKTRPSYHPDLATSYNNIGLAYNGMGDFSKAIEFYKKSVAIKEKALPPNHPDLATSYNNLGSVYNSNGDYTKAFEFYEKALNIREKILPKDHPDVAMSYWHIGDMNSKMNEYSNALSFLEKSLSIYQKSLPTTHPNIKNLMIDIDSVKKKI